LIIGKAAKMPSRRASASFDYAVNSNGIYGTYPTHAYPHGYAGYMNGLRKEK